MVVLGGWVLLMSEVPLYLLHGEVGVRLCECTKKHQSSYAKAKRCEDPSHNTRTILTP